MKNSFTTNQKTITMKQINCKTFTSTLTVGLCRGYTNELISWQVFKNEIRKVQQVVKDKLNVVLSAKIYRCEIVCLGQDEPSATIEFIQYPKFLYEEKVLKEAILFFTKSIQNSLHQNRVVVVFQDVTIMLERNNEIDPTIKIKE